MTTTLTIAWIVSVMRFLQPAAPWIDTYEATATSIERAAQADPLYKGPRGKEQTIDVLLALGWFESRFDPHAAGDSGASLGLFQIAPATADAPKFLLLDADGAAPAAIRLVRQSFAICRDRPTDERLAWYTHGGDGCSPLGVTTSRHRMQKAIWLFEHKRLADFRTPA